MKTVELGAVILEAQPGFACGKQDVDGVFQFRMNNVTSDSTLDLAKRRRVPRNAHQKLERFLVEQNDVLFNATNSPENVGKSVLIPELDELAVYSNHFIRLRPDRGRLDPAYLWRWLQWQYGEGVFQSICQQWVNQATVSRGMLLDMLILVPPLPEQRRIAAILDHADALRAKRRRVIDYLDDLAQSIFLDMFGDPIRNPHGYPLAPLGEVGVLDRGVSRHRPRNDPALLDGPYPLIQTGDVARSGGRITAYSATYSELGLRQSKLWPAGTLCITIAANIAETGILTFDACFPDSVVGFTVDAATTTYVRVWLSFLQATLEASAPQSAQRNINLAILRGLPVPLPDSSALYRFHTVLNASEMHRDLVSAESTELDTLFASLQSRAFRGEL